ncbi:hypothetical protein D3C76_1409470 [compost metagenome]
MRGAVPSLRAIRPELGNCPTRKATSVRSRYRSTISSDSDKSITIFGYSFQKAGSSGSTATIPKPTEQVIRTVPLMLEAPWLRSRSISSSSLSSDWLRW